MKVYFRVDASLHIGSGHVMRCLTLAEELQKYGNSVVFVMRPQAGDLCDYTRDRGFKVQCLPQLSELKIPESTADYQAWLQVPASTDSEDFLSVVTDADLIVIDHYGISAHWEALVKSHASCKLLVIDDLVHDHKSDLVVDQTVNREAREYNLTSPGSHVLTGASYAMLKKRFSELHPLARTKQISKKNHKLLLTMGGIDNPNATLKVLSALLQREKTIQTTVLLSEKAPNFDTVASFCEKHSDWVTHILFCEDMATLMFEHTLAIGAPGSTSWERACIGLPSIMIPLADNQMQICQNLVTKGAALSLSLDEIPEQLGNKLDELFINYKMIRKNSLNLCDGKGCERIVEKMRLLGWF